MFELGITSILNVVVDPAARGALSAALRAAGFDAPADHEVTDGDLHLTETVGLDSVAASGRVLLPAARAERIFQEFLEAAPDAIVLTDAASVIVRINAKGEDLFGYARHEVVGRTSVRS